MASATFTRAASPLRWASGCCGSRRWSAFVSMLRVGPGALATAAVVAAGIWL